jgi:hypothetical protein
MEEQELKSSDLFLVSFLLCKGFKSSKPPTLERHLVTFFFSRTKDLEIACTDFLSRNALVDPLSILESYRTVKVATWEVKRGGASNE